uniref:Uncharacterized protein n=1 Tax=Cacopsylla melanoneura TaxID=428564 RepID=A0A8D8QN97_9HEMI
MCKESLYLIISGRANTHYTYLPNNYFRISGCTDIFQKEHSYICNILCVTFYSFDLLFFISNRMLAKQSDTDSIWNIQWCQSMGIEYAFMQIICKSNYNVGRKCMSNK